MENEGRGVKGMLRVKDSTREMQEKILAKVLDDARPRKMHEGGMALGGNTMQIGGC